MNVTVTGAGGFIGGHLVNRLVDDGWNVTAVDIKNLDEWYQINLDTERLRLDLNEWGACKQAVYGAGYVFNLAADMGGIGYITDHHADCMLSVLITAHMLKASQTKDVQKFLGASSACVYPMYMQEDNLITDLVETDAYPAQPEPGYGEEKLFGERLAECMHRDYGLDVRIPRFHNVYGPYGAYVGGREKAPAAICRKVAEAKILGLKEIEVWGDGEQTRSFMYVDDAVEGMIRLMESDYVHPINLGSNELVSVNQLVDITCDIAGIKLKKAYDASKPQGVRGRNSDNNLIRDVLEWEPSISLYEGLSKTYPWVESQVIRSNV